MGSEQRGQPLEGEIQILLCLSRLGVSPCDLVLLLAWTKVSPDSETGQCRILSVLADHGLGPWKGEHMGGRRGCRM